jgi:hypothetical protein
LSWLSFLKVATKARRVPLAAGILTREQVTEGLRQYRDQLANQKLAIQSIKKALSVARRTGKVDPDSIERANSIHRHLEDLADRLQEWIISSEMKNESDESRSQKFVDDILDVSAVVEEAMVELQDISRDPEYYA